MEVAFPRLETVWLRLLTLRESRQEPVPTSYTGYSSAHLRGLRYAHVFRPKSYKRTSALPVTIAVSILCTSCKTKFWVIDQNRKHFPEVADTAFLRSRPKTTPTLAPGPTSATAKPEVDSRLLADTRHTTGSSL